MARVEIDLPASFLFRTDIPVRIGDVNYGGHVGHDAYLSIAQEARLHFLRARGFATELDLDGVGIMVVDAALGYAAEGNYGMTFRVEIATGEVRSRSFELLYRISDAATGTEIARAKTGIVCYDYAARRVASLPPRLRAALMTAPGS